MKIVVLDGYVLNPGDLSWDALAEMGDTTVYGKTAPQEVVSRIGDADVVFTNKTVLTDDIFAACPSIRYVGVLATGYNVVDIDSAKARGICVCNVPAYSTDAVAQFVFALIFEYCHHVAAHSALVHAGEWNKRNEFSFFAYPLIELKGKTMGLVGFGAIGQRVGQIAHDFGMKVVAYKPSGMVNPPEWVTLTTLDEVLGSADFVSLHCPQTKTNVKMINKESIAKMKDGAVLVNTARGGLVDEQAVADALESGKLACALIDVTTHEPIDKDSPLLTAKNCVITPHIAWSPFETRERLMQIAVDNLRAFAAGRPVNRIV